MFSNLMGSRQGAGGCCERGSAPWVNVGSAERWLSLIGGGALAGFGLSRRSLPGAALAVLGGSLIYRGLTGHCSMYSALGIHTSAPTGERASIPAGHGVKVLESITIDQPVEEVYPTWRNFENLPRFMQHLVSVRDEGRRSHWRAKAPGGMTVGWDAEIINEDRNRLIAWRSLPGSLVATAGAVHFTPAANGQGTEVQVELKYDVPGGKPATWLAWLFGEEPSVQVRDDLRRFKEMMERSRAATATSSPWAMERAL
jgi:uncharacterized membrane protein